MNIERINNEDLSFRLVATISGSDYTEVEDKKLKECKKEAAFKGFRKGKAPMGMIKKIYGDRVLAESVNDVLSEAINNYIKENSLRLIGEPIPQETDKEMEWKSGNDFTFEFLLAEQPKVDFEISDKDKFTLHNINVTKVAEKEMKTNLLKQFGQLKEVETSNKESFIVADLKQGEEEILDVNFKVSTVAEDQREQFVGVKAGDVLKVDVKKMFEDEARLKNILKFDEAKNMDDFNSEFELTIVNVRDFAPAELNQETFDKIAGEPEKIKSEEDLDKFITERLTENYAQEAQFRLGEDIKNAFIEKADLKLPETFLKKWLIYVNNGKVTEEQIEKEFDGFLKDYRWQLVRGFVVEKFDLKFNQDDYLNAAMQFVTYQYAMYGMANVPAEYIKETAVEMLKDRNQFERIHFNVESQKVIETLKENVSVTEKKISLDKFRELGK